LTPKLTGFDDPSKLTTWLKRFSYFGILASIFALYAGTWEYEYLQGLSKGLYLTEDLATEAEDIKDKWVGTAGIFQSFVLFHLVALFMWVYRMNYNTRALRNVTTVDEDMKFTPGWSVGWFFVPIANLWKPYQALKELWVFNHPPQVSEHDRKKKISFIKWFWAFTLISTSLGQRVVVKGFFAEELPQLIQLNKLTFVSDFADIPFYVMTIILVERIYRLQMERFAPRAGEYEQLIREMPISEEAQNKLTRSKRIKRFMLFFLVIWIAFLVALLLFIWFEHLINLD
jgi:hypothetical protein